VVDIAVDRHKERRVGDRSAGRGEKVPAYAGRHAADSR
jgi:hypothetical protein